MSGNPLTARPGLFALKIFCSVVFCTLFCFSPVAQADSWRPPNPSVSYESAAKDARFIVISSGKLSGLVNCSGSVYTKSSLTAAESWVKRWDKPLQNQLSPVTALVANGGWRVVTFDNYYSVGFGDEVIVFYDEAGNLLKKYSLESLLSETELSQVPRSVSSRWWRHKIQLDEKLGLLRVDIGLNAALMEKPKSIKTITFNLWDGERIDP